MRLPLEPPSEEVRAEQDAAALLVLEYLQALFGVAVLVAVALGGILSAERDRVTTALAIGLFLSVAFLCLALRTRLGNPGPARGGVDRAERRVAGTGLGGPYRSARSVVAAGDDGEPQPPPRLEPLACRLRRGVLATGALVAIAAAGFGANLRSDAARPGTVSGGGVTEPAPLHTCTQAEVDEEALRARHARVGQDLLWRER